MTHYVARRRRAPDASAQGLASPEPTVVLIFDRGVFIVEPAPAPPGLAPISLGISNSCAPDVDPGPARPMHIRMRRSLPLAAAGVTSVSAVLLLGVLAPDASMRLHIGEWGQAMAEG